MWVAVTNSEQRNLQVIAYAVWNLMAGFIIPKPRVPGWWIWLLYLNPAHWSFYVSYLPFHHLTKTSPTLMPHTIQLFQNPITHSVNVQAFILPQQVSLVEQSRGAFSMVSVSQV